VVSQDFQGFGGEPTFCTPYRCPKDHEAVPKWPLRLTSAGCSGMGGMQVFSGRSAADKDDPQRPCCDLRHACLQTCGSIKTSCDAEFLKCTQSVCDAMGSEDQREKCRSSASIHELMVKMDQCKKYDAEQYSHCECVPASQARAKRQRVLRSFYKKFNPDSIDKVDGLAKKADSSRKMAGLLMKLYKKYPQVIKQVKDPQQEMMERMMKDAESTKSKEPESEEKDDESDAEDLGVDEL
jgi:Group XII secretory phospholipase A2 precursor (PLA2G12)